MVSLDEVVLSGNKYRLAHDSLLPRGKRAWSRTIRSADIADPGTIKTARWEIASPIGDSREDLATGYLGTDWTENLDGSNFQLLTGTAESSTISLTTAISVQYALPDSTLSITGNWAETNPGGTDGNAEDEVGNGIEGGTPDNTTFWSVNASGPSHQLNVGLSNVTDPGVETGHVIRFRAKHTHASLGRITIQLRQDSDVVYATAPYVTDSIGDYEIEVPETRIADITDYTDLSFSIRMYSGSVAGTLTLYEIELQVGAVGTSGTDNVSRLVEIEGQLFAARGTNTSQIDPGATEEVEATDHGQVVTDVSGAFAGEAYLCFGQAQAVRKITGINASGATFTAVTSPATVKAYLATVGADRVWLSNAGGGDDDGKVQYALTAVTSATLSNAFTVGNPDEPQNGITAVGERMMVGFETGVNSFTAAGAPVRLIESLKDAPSTANGRSGDYIWGWAYVPTRTGL